MKARIWKDDPTRLGSSIARFQNSRLRRQRSAADPGKQGALAKDADREKGSVERAGDKLAEIGLADRDLLEFRT